MDYSYNKKLLMDKIMKICDNSSISQRIGELLCDYTTRIGVDDFIKRYCFNKKVILG